MHKLSKSFCLALFSALALVACGGGSGPSEPATGEVSVVLTDGPTDQYERILISMTRMTLIGPGGQVDLYDGPELTFDLLQMSDWADLAFTTKVRAGRYNKIRLELSRVELVDLADNSVERLNQLPANGKIDLSPRGPFEVSPEYTTVIKLDMDARRSFQVVATGNGKLKLRPVIFVDIFQDNIFLPERLVRVFGNVDPDSISGAGDSDPTNDALRLCNLEFIAQSDGPSMGDLNTCVKVYGDAATSLFDAVGDPTDWSALMSDQPVTAVGFLTESDDTEAALGLNAVVLEIGDREPAVPAGWDTRKGLVAGNPVDCGDSALCFSFDPDDTATMDTVPARMRPETRVFRADGIELARTDVTLGDGGSLDAVEAGGELQTALVVLSTDVASGLIEGTLDSVSGSDPYVLGVLTDAGGLFRVCADPTDGVIVQVLVDDEAVTILDLMDLSILEPGARIEAVGESGPPPAGCDINADQIIVESPAS